MFPPKLIATSVVRGAQQGQSHGGVYLIDFAHREVQQVVDWNTGDIDFTGRGWDRGLRGIAFHGGEVYIAASDELFVYDRVFRIVRSFRNRYLKHCHEISAYEGRLFVASTGFDSLLRFDPQTQRFDWALHIAEGQEGWAGRVYDPNGPAGPPLQNLLHLNNVHAEQSGLYLSGMRTRARGGVKHAIDRRPATGNAHIIHGGGMGLVGRRISGNGERRRLCRQPHQKKCRHSAKHGPTP